VTLCEAIMRRRMCGRGGSTSGTSALVALIDFLGPLPESLVARHPCREELFTPEGHVLRPADSAAGLEALEAIEPAAPPVAPTDGSGNRILRPRLVAQALEGMTGANEVLEFLGRLLHPDPEQRPSAREAMAHHFLRFAQTRQASVDADTNVIMVRESASSTAMVQGTYKTGSVTGPVFKEMGRKLAQDLGIADITSGVVDEEIVLEAQPQKEEEQNEPIPKSRLASARSESNQEGFLAIASQSKRKGIALAPEMGPLKCTRVQKEEAVKSTTTKKVAHKEEHHAKVDDSHGDGQKKLGRKGTGFVHMGELPPSDSEEEEEESHPVKEHVKIQDSHADNSNKITRKGTGFVHVGELPPSDSEEEEEPVKEHAKIADSHGDNENKITRKGTGFVHMGELPPSDDEDDEDEEEHAPVKKVGIEDDGSDEKKASHLARKGTGYVHMTELPPSDDEDEEEDEGAMKKGVQIQDSKADEDGGSTEASGPKFARKGTGYVSASDLPDDEEDEEDEDEGVKRKVQIEASEADSGPPAKPCRKGTGFVNAAELPDDDDDEDEDEEGGTANVRFHSSVADAPEPKKTSVPTQVRKGTGFVSAADLPESDGESDDEPHTTHEGGKVQVGPGAHVKAHTNKKVKRQESGFVHSCEYSDEEDEEEEKE